MTEEERRRCCLLGGCGCGSGSPAQRQAMKEWWTAKLAGFIPSTVAAAIGNQRLGEIVGGWLDELPWEKAAEG
jgi:hypothetical protein